MAVEAKDGIRFKEIDPSDLDDPFETQYEWPRLSCPEANKLSLEFGELKIDKSLTVKDAIATKQLSVSGSVTGSLTVENDLTVGNAIATKQLSVTDQITGSLKIENNLSLGGKVGIGTTNPAQKAKLDVNGRLFLRDGLDFGGTAADGYGTAGMISWGNDNNFVIFGREGYGLRLGANLKTGGSDLYALNIDTKGNVGIGTKDPVAKLEVSGDIQVSGKLSSQNGRVRRDFVTWNTNQGTSHPIHIKTNIPKKSNIMYRILVEGYNYGVAAAINSDVVGYTYAGWESIGKAQTNDYANGVSISQYYSSDGYVIIKLTTSNTYYIGFSASAWFTNPTGNSFDISATVHHQANDL